MKESICKFIKVYLATAAVVFLFGASMGLLLENGFDWNAIAGWSDMCGLIVGLANGFAPYVR